MKQVRSSKTGKPRLQLKRCSEFPLYEFSVVTKKVYRLKTMLSDQPKTIYGCSDRLYVLMKDDGRVKIKESQLWELVIKENPCVDF